MLYLNPVDTPITKNDLKEFGEKLGRDVAETVRRDLRVELQETKADIISHFNASQGKQNERMDRMDQRMDRMEGNIVTIKDQLNDVAEDVGKIKSAVLDLMATDRHLHNLVRELKRNGIALDEARVFAA